MKTKDLSPSPKNPRKITDEQLSRLDKSLNEFGDLGCIVYNVRTKRLVGGHQRTKIIPKESDIVIEEEFEVPTEVGTVALGYILHKGEKHKYREVDWDETKELAANLAANKQGGEFDYSILPDVLLELDGANVDWDLTGFGLDEIENLLAPFKEEIGLTDEDSVPEVKQSFVKLGDVYLLGEHRLMCGDSTSIDAVERLMSGEKADMVFTDPPYNIAYIGGSKLRDEIKNDSMASDDFYQFLMSVYGSLFIATKAGAAIYVSHADTERVNFTRAFVDSGFHLSSVIIWAKNNATFGRQDYFWKHEPILYGWNSSGAHKFHGPNNEETIWSIDRPSKSDAHPTMKPIELVERAVKNSSLTSNLVLDLFGGSGSTLIACEKTNRKCFMMELDEHYCQVIIERWQNFTGKQAVLESKSEALAELT